MEVKDINDAIEKQGKAYQALIDGVKQDLAEFKKTDLHDSLTKDKLDKITADLADVAAQKARLDKIETAMKRRSVVDANGEEISNERVEHRKGFEGYLRKGRDTGLAGGASLADLEQKALSVSSDPDGGYTAPVELDREITRIVTEISDIRPLATVRTIGSPSLKRLVNLTGTSSGWVGETDARTQTNNAQFSALEFPAHEIYAMPAASQNMLDDSFVNVESWVSDEVGIEVAAQEGNAFINGDGVKKPHGILGYTNITNASYAWGSVGYVPTGAAGAFKTTAAGDDYKNIVDLVFSLKKAYRNGASFLMSRLTLAGVMKMIDSQGRPLWRPGMEVGTPALLLNYPITEAEDMPTIAANSYSIAFGDFKRAYLIVDRFGTRVLRDPFTAKPYVLFYVTKRVGGGIQNFEALKLMKFAAT